MADFSLFGRILSVRYLQESVIVFIEEYKLGYKKQDGTIVDEKSLVWKIIYPMYFKKYISKHFSDGMIVKVKGEIYPYMLIKGEESDGYSVRGETINLAAYPKNLHRERKMIKETLERSDEKPDLDGFMEDDFR